MINKKHNKTLTFTISSGGGDGAYLCYQETTKKIYDFFIKNDLDLHKYALDCDYADEKKIPEDMRPFEAGARAEFGYYECGMTFSDDLELTVEDEDSNEVFSGYIPKKNVKQNKKASEILKNMKKGIYLVGYEGLEDCYISGQIELEPNFDLKKFKLIYCYFNYELSDRDFISSITYDGVEIDWSLGSYEGTGDNSFEFIDVKNKSATILDDN